jgi:hypothetical protein
MPASVTWTFTTWTGLGFSWTPDNLVYNAATPCVNDASWYPKQKETVWDGAYRRITTLAVDGSVDKTYSNGTDGMDALISVDVTEYFDHTTTKPQSNSARFSIYTPFDKLTSAATIAAFVADFAVDTPFQIEGGWKTLTSMGYDAYDTTSMGYYFITSAKINKDTWTLDVEGHDAFGRLALGSVTDFPQSSLIADTTGMTSPVGEWNIDGLFDANIAMAAVFDSAPTNPQQTSIDLFLGVDAKLARLRFYAPLHANVTSLDILQRLTNYSGGRWYLTHDGHKTLVLEDAAKLDYKINPLMMYGHPLVEDYDPAPLPHRVATYGYGDKYGNTGTLEVVCEIPRIGGLDALGNPKDMLVVHDGAWGKKVYGLSGVTETEVAVIAAGTEHLYNTSVPASAWVITGTTLYDSLVIKGIPFTETQSDTGASADGSAIENPLVVRGQEQNAILSWSFPDNDGRAYTWSMRDDPSLKCGNVVQLAVDNEYLDVLLIEAKRSFNGAGRVEFLGVYISNTGEALYDTLVHNPVATWVDGTGGVAGVRITWDAATGYEEWSNPRIFYRVYRTSDTPDTPLVLQEALTYTTEATVGDTFGVALVVGGVEYATSECSVVLFDNTPASMRSSGEWLFYSGQARLVYGQDEIS